MEKTFTPMFDTSYNYLVSLDVSALGRRETESRKYYSPIFLRDESGDVASLDDFMQYFIDNNYEARLSFLCRKRYGGWSVNYSLTPYTMNLVQTLIKANAQLLDILKLSNQVQNVARRSMADAQADHNTNTIGYLATHINTEFFSCNYLATLHHFIYWYLLTPFVGDLHKVGRLRTNLTNRVHFVQHYGYSRYLEDLLHGYIGHLFKYYVISNYHLEMTKYAIDHTIKNAKGYKLIERLNNYLTVLQSIKDGADSLYQAIYNNLYSTTKLGTNIEELRLHGCADPNVIVETVLNSSDKYSYTQSNIYTAHFPDIHIAPYADLLKEGQFNFSYSNNSYSYNNWIHTEGRNGELLRTYPISEYRSNSLETCRNYILSTPLGYFSFAMDITGKTSFGRGDSYLSTRYNIKKLKK